MAVCRSIIFPSFIIEGGTINHLSKLTLSRCGRKVSALAHTRVCFVPARQMATSWQTHEPCSGRHMGASRGQVSVSPELGVKSLSRKVFELKKTRWGIFLDGARGSV